MEGLVNNLFQFDCQTVPSQFLLPFSINHWLDYQGKHMASWTPASASTRQWLSLLIQHNFCQLGTQVRSKRQQRDNQPLSAPAATVLTVTSKHQHYLHTLTKKGEVVKSRKWRGSKKLRCSGYLCLPPSEIQLISTWTKPILRLMKPSLPQPLSWSPSYFSLSHSTDWCREKTLVIST